MPAGIALKLASRLLLQPLHRQLRGMTLGTRTAAFGPDGTIMLVRHSYGPGWMLPGGGVERGETIFASAVRELREEAGIVAREEPLLHGLFLNDADFPGDHVAVFTLRQFSTTVREPSVEIAEARFFQLAALPETVSAGTRRRLAEIADGGAPAHVW